VKHYFSDFKGTPGSVAYCSPQTADIIRNSLKDIDIDAVHYVGNGNYHYISLFYLEKIQEEFALVLFDHHPDNQEGAFCQDLLSCGSWVKTAKESLPLLKNDYWIGGPQEPVIDTALPLYLSIDLDILSPQYIRTVWDQGDMTVSELLDRIRELTLHHRIIGVDICGAESIDDPIVAKLIAFFAKY